MKLSKTLLAVMGATLVTVASVAGVSARQFEFSHSGLRARFPTWEITNPFGAVVRCELTVELRLHERRVAKVSGSLIGYITRAALGACGANTAAQIQVETLPWHLRYESFTGVLPSITRIGMRVIEMGWNITEAGSIRCLIRTSAAEPAKLAFNREAGGALTQAIWSGEIGTGPECFGGRARIAGASNSLTALEQVNRVTVTLI